MNIFYLDKDPERCAVYHCDKHVNKMIVEHLQMISVALDHHGFDPARKKDGNFYSTRAYKNHPCTKWVKESLSNLTWTWELTWHLCDQFESRYGKKHSGRDSLRSVDLQLLDGGYPDLGLTPPAQAMPDFCKVPGDPVLAYRNYYNMLKWRFATWRTTSPSWWAPYCSVEQREQYV